MYSLENTKKSKKTPVGLKISALAENLGMSPADLAEAAEISLSTLHDLFYGKTSGVAKSLIAVSNALQVEPWQLLAPEHMEGHRDDLVKTVRNLDRDILELQQKNIEAKIECLDLQTLIEKRDAEIADLKRQLASRPKSIFSKNEEKFQQLRDKILWAMQSFEPEYASIDVDSFIDSMLNEGEIFWLPFAVDAASFCRVLEDRVRKLGAKAKASKQDGTGN